MAYTSTKSALKFQASAMNSCWEKWDRKLIVKWMDRHTRVIQYTPISFGAGVKNTLKLRLNDSYFFYQTYADQCFGMTTKQLTLYFLRKSAKIIYNGLFPSFIFLFLRKWFQERMYFLSCWKTVFREKFCSFNWKLSSFSIPYSFNPIKVIVMLLE